MYVLFRGTLWYPQLLVYSISKVQWPQAWKEGTCMHTHTPSVWGHRSLGRRSVVHTLRQPVVGSKLFVIRHHIPLLAPVPGFSNLFHLTGGAIYTFLLLMSRKRKQACQDRKERKTAG